MGTNSKIDWTDHTWNPWYGCPDDGKRSPACDNCYARAWARRSGIVDFDREIKRAADSTFNAPLNRNKYKPGDRVFVCSLSDFFHEDVPFELHRDAYNIIARRPDLIWIFLTKRPERISRMNWVMSPVQPNLWLGVTAENQEQADRRIPELLKIPASVHFLSCEPLLGAIDLGQFFWREASADEIPGSVLNDGCTRMLVKRKSSVDWVICGGESGANARAMHPDWARSLRDQCKETGTPFFFKQWGKRGAGNELDGRVHQEWTKCK